MKKTRWYQQNLDKSETVNRYRIVKLSIGVTSLLAGQYILGNVAVQAQAQEGVDQVSYQQVNAPEDDRQDLAQEVEETTDNQSDSNNGVLEPIGHHEQSGLQSEIETNLEGEDVAETDQQENDLEISPQSRAATQSSDEDYATMEYTIFPNPQSIQYHEGIVDLDRPIHVVSSANIDSFTVQRAREVFDIHEIDVTFGQESDSARYNVHLQTYVASETDNDALFNEIDAYRLTIQEDRIDILGKDTDAVFYGLTTLKHMMKQVKQPILRQVTIEDYADIKNRAFIEGYYGNPWSVEDRIELMKYGGELKMNQYFFAPKDDIYHNSSWRELYPEEQLEDIRRMAQAGNESKTLFVWTLHPFMHQKIDFSTDQNYQRDLNVIQAKFTQLMDAGVRQFGILADDAPHPVGGYNSYTRLMEDLTQWLTQKQSEYDGLKTDMIFVPHEYWGNGREQELRTLNSSLPSNVDLVLTGGRIWGEASNNFLNTYKNNITQTESNFRAPYLWINWPCTDNAKKHLILGGGDTFLHPGLERDLISGVMLNPMQQAEPSKIAIFQNADFTWNIWQDKSQADKANEIAFHFADHLDFQPTEASQAYRELGKHMINQNMDTRVRKLEESIELAPKLAEFSAKLEQGTVSDEDIQVIKAEFDLLKESAQLYKTSPGNERMRDQIIYWLDNMIDQADAMTEILKGIAVKDQDTSQLWQHYSRARQLYEQSKTHQFWYVNHFERAEVGVQHIRPFMELTLNYLSEALNEQIFPDVVTAKFITNRQDQPTGDLSAISDNNLNSEVIFKTPTRIQVDEYVGVTYNTPIQLNNFVFAMGRNGNLTDTFNKAKVQYRDAQEEWHDLEMEITGNEAIIAKDGLDIEITGLRLISQEEKTNTWLAVREILVNTPLSVDHEVAVTKSDSLELKQNTTLNNLNDNSDTTHVWVSSNVSQGFAKDTTPVDAWLQLDLGKETDIAAVRLLQDANDKITNGVIEYSLDGNEWQTLTAVSGETLKTTNEVFSAQYVRVRNLEATPRWWKVYDFSVEEQEKGKKEWLFTNVDNWENNGVIQVEESLFRLDVDEPVTLNSGQYIGMKLDRIHELSEIQVGDLNENLTVEYSDNAVEWYTLESLAKGSHGRYIRLVNETDVAIEVSPTILSVETVEVTPPYFVSTTIEPHTHYSSHDARNRNELHHWFDGDLNTAGEFSNFPTEGGHITYHLGQTREISSIRAYIQDGTINYVRDGVIQVSQDGQEWVDVVTIGDGVENQARDNSLEDGYTHDSTNPGNRYVEGRVDTPVTANYLRVYFTAPYRHRFVTFNEIILNDGEYVPTQNLPAFDTTIIERQGHEKSNWTDGNVLTSYIPNQEQGKVVYHLSENTHHNHVAVLVSPDSVASDSDTPVIRVRARVSDHEDGSESYWREVGVIDESFKRLAVAGNVHLFDLEFSWENGTPEFYELMTYYEEIDQQPSENEEEIVDDVTSPQEDEEDTVDDVTPSEGDEEDSTDDPTSPKENEEDTVDDVTSPQEDEEDTVDDVTPPEEDKEDSADDATSPQEDTGTSDSLVNFEPNKNLGQATVPNIQAVSSLDTQEKKVTSLLESKEDVEQSQSDELTQQKTIVESEKPKESDSNEFGLKQEKQKVLNQGAVLPETGENSPYAIFSLAALSILASVGLIESKKKASELK